MLSALCVALLQSSIAQISFPGTGGRANGTGYAITCLSDGWSAVNNIGGTGTLQKPQAGITYNIVPGMRSFRRMDAFVAVPMKFGTLSSSASTYGDELYHENLVTLGYSSKLGLAALGIRGDFIEYYAEGFGRKILFSFSAGGIAELTPWLSVGALLINGLQPEIADGEHIPTFLLAGVSLKPTDAVTLLAEVEHDLDHTPTFKCGMEYLFHTRFAFRTGVNVNPQAAFFGFGFRPKRFHFDYGYSYYPESISRHQVSLTFLAMSKK